MTAGPLAGITARARQALDAGKSREEVVRDFIAGGLSRSAAERFVARAISAQSPPSEPVLLAPGEAGAETTDTGGRAALVSGAFWLSLGCTVTGSTFLLASPGQTYTVAYGAVLVGLVAFGRGLKRWMEASQPFPWVALLIAVATPPLGVTLLVGITSWRRHNRLEMRRAAEERRLDEARAVQKDARAAAEREAADEARTRRHAGRIARARETLQTSSHAVALCDAALELGRSGAREAIPDLAELLGRRLESATSRECAAAALIELGEAERALAFYVECARAGTHELRRIAFLGFKKIGPASANVALPHLGRALSSSDSRARESAVDSAAKLGPAALPLLREAAQDSDERVRRRAAEALAAIEN